MPTTSVITPGSVLGSTPWPRLNTWPAAPASTARRPSSTTARTARSTTGQPANSTTGSRLPCSAVPGPTRAAASVSDVRQSTPTTVAPASRHRAEQFGGAHPEVRHRHTRARERREHPRAVRQHVAAVVGQRQRSRPRVEHLDRVHAGRRPATCRNAIVTSVSVVISACQVSGSPSIIALVRSWLRLGPPSTR